MRHKITADLKYPELQHGCYGAWSPVLGPSGSTLIDQSPYRRDGTLSGGLVGSDWDASGGYGSLKLNGTSDYISTPNTGLVSIYSTHSISGWIRLASTGANRGIWGSGRTSSLSDVFLRVSSADKLQYFEFANGAYSLSGATSLTAGPWYHVASVRFGDSVIIYLNGKSDGTGTKVQITNTQNTTDVIGAIMSSGSPTNYFAGDIADVRIYRRMLSATEIRTLAIRPGIAYETIRRTRYGSTATPPSTNTGNLMLLGVG